MPQCGRKLITPTFIKLHFHFRSLSPCSECLWSPTGKLLYIYQWQQFNNKQTEQAEEFLTDEWCSHFRERWFSKLIYVIQFWRHHYVTGEMGGSLYCHQISFPLPCLLEIIVILCTQLHYFLQFLIFAKQLTEVVSEYNFLFYFIILHKAVLTHSLHIKGQDLQYSVFP